MVIQKFVQNGEFPSLRSRNESDWYPWVCRFDPQPHSVGWGSGIVVSCYVGRRRGLDPKLLWLWHRLTAVALIRPLAWELPYAMVVALEKQKKKKKKKKKIILNGGQKFFSLPLFQVIVGIFRRLHMYPLSSCLNHKPRKRFFKITYQWIMISFFIGIFCSPR